MTAVRQASTFVLRPPMSVPAEIRLTPRELEVLALTAEGLTSKEIGRHLGISPRTADVHRTHLIHKLGLRNRVEAVHYAIRSGILVGRPAPLSNGPAPHDAHVTIEPEPS
jgi:DNA-binding CsgD family transcriptional regulator